MTYLCSQHAAEHKAYLGQYLLDKQRTPQLFATSERM